jgi:isopentenyldiphosphate isomerase
MAVTDETPVPDPEEIAGIAWWHVDELAARVAQHPADFTPPFRVLFRWYLEHRGQRP